MIQLAAPARGAAAERSQVLDYSELPTVALFGICGHRDGKAMETVQRQSFGMFYSFICMVGFVAIMCRSFAFSFRYVVILSSLMAI